jgi:hypothetical protein
MYTLNSEVRFGKFKGQTVKEIIDLGPTGKQYIQWASEKFMELGDDIKEYMKTGKIIVVKNEPEYDANDFWGLLALNGPTNNVPF